MPSREHLTTCPFPQHCMENQTCRSFFTSLSPVPPDPRLLFFFSKPSKKPGTVL